jgi:Ca-activated chloride channel family protein
MEREFFQFAHPAWLLLLALLGYLAWREALARRKGRDAVLHSHAGVFARFPRGARARLAFAVPVLRYAALALLVVALARPQFGTEFEKITSEGVDIVLVLDVSGSMLAEDFRPRNRLQVAKDVARDFVGRRPQDRIGVVAFAGQSVPRCPPTLDHSMLDGVLAGLEVGELEDGTAIGMGIATALERLRHSESKSRMVILLTDGVNNRGRIDPLTAAELARPLKVKIYTIGVGSRGDVPYPFEHPIFGKQYRNVRIELDEATLGAIAERTGGQYFLATDPDALEEIFQTIDRLEKTRIESRVYTRYRELYQKHLRRGAVLLAVGIALGLTIFRKTP